jgi:hypothetical protein
MAQAKKPRSVFESLNGINVNEKTEKKGNLTYLSWAWAWSEVKTLYPDVSRKVYETPEGMNYFNDGRTAWVKVGVTINEIEHIDYLPIMDFRNSSIVAEKITSFDVNKAIQRSTTKALALHGLGLYIYAGEDLPEGYEVPEPPKPKLDNKRLEGALKSIEAGNFSKEKLYSMFTLTATQKKNVETFVKSLNSETKKDKKDDNTDK